MQAGRLQGSQERQREAHTVDGGRKAKNNAEAAVKKKRGGGGGSTCGSSRHTRIHSIGDRLGSGKFAFPMRIFADDGLRSDGVIVTRRRNV
jgi:hypothetical protein